MKSKEKKLILILVIVSALIITIVWFATRGKAIYTANVENGTISLEADAYTGNYDGKDHDAVSNVKVTPSDATLTYSLNGGEFSSTIPKINDLGKYTITATAADESGIYATCIVTVDKVYLYNEGDECSNITGGWLTSSYSTYSGTNPKVTKNSSYIDVYTKNTANNRLYCFYIYRKYNRYI